MSVWGAPPPRAREHTVVYIFVEMSMSKGATRPAAARARPSVTHTCAVLARSLGGESRAQSPCDVRRDIPPFMCRMPE
jgi:hypothetical protein